MSTRFLPREIGSIDTGPQIFAGTEVPNTTISFAETLGLLNSVKVEGAGLSILNGIFSYTAEYANRPYYNKDGDGNLFVIYNFTEWEIYDFSENENPIYISEVTDVNYPWNVSRWISLEGYEPAPIVTKVL